MDEFLVGGQTHCVETLLEEVFHSLYIMVGYCFMCFDCLRIGYREVLIYGTQACGECIEFFGRCGKIGQLRQWQACQGDEIFHLHFHAVAYQCEF